MAKISNTTVYPNIIPTANDYLLLTDVNDNNETKTSKVTDFQKFFGTLTREVTITSTQILSSFSNPVELIPAPGAGYYIIPFGTIVVKNNFKTNPYSFTLLGGFITQTDGVSTAGWTIITKAFLEKGFTEVQSFAAVDNNTLAAPTLTGMDNRPLLFQADTANPTGGDGTLTFNIQYRIVQI